MFLCTDAYLKSIVDMLADQDSAYPGNTTSGVGVVSSADHADVEDNAAARWTLTPLTASIDFKSAYAVS